MWMWIRERRPPPPPSGAPSLFFSVINCIPHTPPFLTQQNPPHPIHTHPTVLADRLAQFVHFFTLNYSLRPFGAAIVVAGYDAFRAAHELYIVEPSGVAYVSRWVVGVCVCVRGDVCFVFWE